MNAAELESSARRRERGRLFVALAVVLAVVICAALADARPGSLWDAAALKNVGSLLQGFSSPDFSSEFLVRVSNLLLESLAIALLGLAVALLLGVPLAFAAARIPGLSDPPAARRWGGRLFSGIRWSSRALLSLLRGIPEIIWAFLFVRILGLGPGPAVLAIGLSFAGIIGKLFSELLEAADPRPVVALEAAGGRRLDLFLYALLPQVRSQWVGYGCFRLECAIRSASILGIVGAGGIGYEIDLSIRYFQYDKLATALLVILACVVLFELLSAVLRRSPAIWSIGVVVVGGLFGIARLEIPWAGFASVEVWTQLSAFVQGFASPTLETGFLWRSLTSTGETLAIAFASTGIAAMFGLALSPFASRLLMIRRYLPDPPSVRGPWRWFGWLAFGGTRLLFQLSRAMPELVWAMIFVVWVGPGPFAGLLAVTAHTVGIFGRLFGEVYEEVEPEPLRALEAAGCGPLARWSHGVLPQVGPRLLSYTLFRFEVNVRITAMMGFVGAGGIGDAIHTAISLFHFDQLASLLLILLTTVVAVDMAGDFVRQRLIRRN